MLSWHSNCPRRRRVRIEYLDRFHARGMRLVYGRGDRWGYGAIYNMDVWLSRKGDLFARFWSRSKNCDDVAIAIHGIPLDAIPERVEGEGFVDDWIPKAVRDEYEMWIERGW